MIVTVVVLAGARSSRVTLNVPQVLLPLVPSSGVRANFTLTADKGCFTWCALIKVTLKAVQCYTMQEEYKASYSQCASSIWYVSCVQCT